MLNSSGIDDEGSLEKMLETEKIRSDSRERKRKRERERERIERIEILKQQEAKQRYCV